MFDSQVGKLILGIHVVDVDFTLLRLILNEDLSQYNMLSPRGVCTIAG